MTSVAKSVHSMQRHITWVSFLYQFFENFGWWYHLGLKVFSFFLRFIFVSGTLLMTRERQRAFWAIYGEVLRTMAYKLRAIFFP